MVILCHCIRVEIGLGLQVKWVTFCAGQPGHTQIIEISGSGPDSTLIALLEYFDLLAHALKVLSCYLFSYRLANQNASFYIR